MKNTFSIDQSPTADEFNAASNCPVYGSVHPYVTDMTDALREQLWMLDDAPVPDEMKEALREAYWLKERLYDLYDMPKAEAIAAYDAYADSIPAGMKKHFSDLTRLMRNWRTEIINYLDFPITNGYTEAYNGVLKVINRNGRGYEFDVLRAKALSRKPRTKISKPMIIPAGFQRLYSNNEGHQMLIEALGNTCTSCGGKFAELHAHDIPAILPSQKPKRDYICATCYARFHTQEVGHGNHDSTPKCE